MYAQINDFSMAFTDAGQGDPLLFIHGFPLNRTMWKSQVEALSAKARVLAPDLRGHGDSQAITGPYSVEMFADDLAALLDHVHITQPVVVCGLSMGGYVAFAFYRKYAHRMKGLILTATKAGDDPEPKKEDRDKAAQKVRDQGITIISRSMISLLLAPKTYLQQPALIEQLSAIMDSTSVEGAAGVLIAMKNRPDSTEMLPEIRIPTLIIHGEKDQIIPVQEAQAMAAALPQASLKIFEASGHMPNLEQPDEFNRVVREFMGRL